ncbi:MAG TPA: archaeosortase/exosortase family protein [Stenomitos sp.]
MLSDRRFSVLCTALGLTVGLVYSAAWVKLLIHFSMGGSVFALLSLASAYLALENLWKRRSELSALPQMSRFQRRLGCSLILFGTALFVAGYSRLWVQAVGWAIVLVGLVLCQWGIGFWRSHRRTVLLMGLSIYPGIARVLETVWNGAIPGVLERITAQTATMVLQFGGQSAFVEGVLIHLSNSGVEVSTGCNGLPTMLAILWVGLLISCGLRRWHRLMFLGFGIGLAFIFNAVRVAYLTLIAVYGTHESFEFWHGDWGAQIFIAPLFLVYYFVGFRSTQASYKAG